MDLMNLAMSFIGTGLGFLFGNFIGWLVSGGFKNG